MENIELVKHFINNVFSPRKEGGVDENGYKDIKNYFPFYNFNFDWLNYITEVDAQKCKTAYEKFKEDNISVPRPDKIMDLYKKLTGLSEESFKYLFIAEPDNSLVLSSNGRKRNSDGYRGESADPDSMKIVKAILCLIHEDIIDNCDNFSGDTMNSLRSVIGELHYENEKKYLGENYEFIFMYDKIKYFDKIGCSTDEETDHTNDLAKEFFNKYHTLGNFVLTPSKLTGQSINQMSGSISDDNYYGFVQYLQHLLAFYGQFSINGVFNKSLYFDSLIIPHGDYDLYKKVYEKKDQQSIREYIQISELIISERCSEMIIRLFTKLNSESEFKSKDNC